MEIFMLVSAMFLVCLIDELYYNVRKNPFGCWE
ncbi:hypothetical protein [Salmonella phage SSBI34]|nr:hypothetical protein [Salmonella phage SSBI34]